ncbi:MAG: hypothetical protein ACUVQ5_00110 [Candidatus Methanomethylicaceae archaeon]
MARGIARIYDAVMAITVLLVVLTISLEYTSSFNVYEGWRDLSEFSSNLLVYLDRNGLLAQMIYREEYERLKAVLSGVLPPGLGFKLSVYSCEWKLLWSVDHQYNPSRSSSGIIFLSGYEGVPDVRIVVLSLSR